MNSYFSLAECRREREREEKRERERRRRNVKVKGRKEKGDKLKGMIWALYANALFVKSDYSKLFIWEGRRQFNVCRTFPRNPAGFSNTEIIRA